jgi:hypothetical protein
MSRKNAANSAALRQQVLASGSYLERQLVSVNDDIRATHRAAAVSVRKHGTEPAQLLLEAFERFNAAYFGNRLAAPLVLIMNPTSARAYGDYCAKDVHGLESRIRVAPRVFAKGHLFVLDVLLHEMVHAFCNEVLRDQEPGYRGHGPVFARACNTIGELLGLPPVAEKGRRGLPDCAQWPLNVRPEGYYPEPFVSPKARKKAAEPDAPTETDDTDETDDAAERKRSVATLRALRARLTEACDVTADECDAIDHAIELLEC